MGAWGALVWEPEAWWPSVVVPSPDCSTSAVGPHKAWGLHMCYHTPWRRQGQAPNVTFRYSTAFEPKLPLLKASESQQSIPLSQKARTFSTPRFLARV